MDGMWIALGLVYLSNSIIKAVKILKDKDDS